MAVVLKVGCRFLNRKSDSQSYETEGGGDGNSTEGGLQVLESQVRLTILPMQRYEGERC